MMNVKTWKYGIPYVLMGMRNGGKFSQSPFPRGRRKNTQNEKNGCKKEDGGIHETKEIEDRERKSEKEKEQDWKKKRKRDV